MSVHNVWEVLVQIHQVGILVLFLPPYNPDLNPIEEACSYVKSYLKIKLPCKYVRNVYCYFSGACGKTGAPGGLHLVAAWSLPSSCESFVMCSLANNFAL